MGLASWLWTAKHKGSKRAEPDGAERRDCSGGQESEKGGKPEASEASAMAVSSRGMTVRKSCSLQTMMLMPFPRMTFALLLLSPRTQKKKKKKEEDEGGGKRDQEEWIDSTYRERETRTDQRKTPVEFGKASMDFE